MTQQNKQAKAVAQARTADQAASGARTVALAPALLAALLGTFIIFGVGFVNAAAMHDAAHDTRHAASFPCH